MAQAEEKIGKLIPAALRRRYSSRGVSAGTDTTVVHLINAPRRLPATPIERRLFASLEAGPVPFTALVQRVADELYAEELRQGGAVVDIGLFGSRLFNRDVMQELDAANGILWEIKHGRQNA
jgi:hypothetical protein